MNFFFGLVDVGYSLPERASGKINPEPGTLEKELDIYRLLHVKSLISFLFTSF